jgi:hypothetical protein
VQVSSILLKRAGSVRRDAQVGEKLTEMSLRTTLSYRFGGPVIAKY